MFSKSFQDAKVIRRRFLFAAGLVLVLVGSICRAADSPAFQLATFSADVTIPLNHRCMGVLPQKSVKVLDPLEAHGFVLLGGEAPVVFVAVDWCEIRNEAYDRWRTVLAAAAATSPQHVLVTSLHQHDAPVVDAGAATLLRAHDLPNELYDEQFHEEAVQRVATALRESLLAPVRITHFGTGQGKVEGIASNRRVVRADGSIHFDRGSRSASDPVLSAAPEGLIDPWLKTLSFWNEATPVLALSVYATHPMSSYGRGEISADFVGLARRQQQLEFPQIKQLYAAGCSGDLTAGKYNNGSPEHRRELVAKLQAGMQSAWTAAERHPLQRIQFRVAPLELEFYNHAALTQERLEQVLASTEQSTEARILAAMGLSSRARVAARQPIDVPCLDFGSAKVVLLPGEAFVGYQLLAQSLAPEAFVVTIGYGECWPGYIPTNDAFADHFHDQWLWVAPGSESRIQQVLDTVLNPSSN